MMLRILRLAAQSRQEQADRSMTKPKPMRARLVRCQARSVRSAANSTRGSGGLGMVNVIVSGYRHACLPRGDSPDFSGDYPQMVEAAGQLIHLFRDRLDYAFIPQRLRDE
jgi:hypothetical protein